MRSKKKIIITTFIGAIMLLAGCHSAGTDQKQKDNKKSDSETVKIEDIDWNVGEGIIDGDRHIVMNYVNNSKLDIVYFGLDYTEKEEITEEEKQKFYSDIEKKFNLSDDDMIKIKEETIGMNTSVERLVKEGDEVSNVPCHYFSGIYYLKDKAHLELMQPDIATIEFVSNGRLYTEYYDFKSQKYSLESDSEEAVQWTEKEIGTEIDKPEAEVIKVTLDLDDYLCFDVYGVSKSQFEAYIDLCKERGYTKDADKDEDSYDAERDDEYSVSVDYDQTDCIMDVSVSK